MSETRQGRLIAGRRRAVTGALIALLMALPSLFVPERPADALDSPPNFVLIVTDDQRWDSLGEMQKVDTRLAKEGVTFTNGFVVNPVCCPSRVSSLTGLYSHWTGVYGNSGEHGGFQAFTDPKDQHTIAKWLQDDGYQTALIGRYLIGYGQEPEYRPPGWDRWNALIGEGDGGFYNYQITRTDPIEDPDPFGDTPDAYSTDVLAGKAVDFIENANDADPLFLYFTPTAPHREAIPHPDHEAEFDDLEKWRPPSFNEKDMSDKPKWLAKKPRLSARRIAENDEFRENQYATLESVDEAVDRILDALANEGRLENTVIVFTSDNSIHWGEHRWTTKTLPYNESIHVPLVIRYDPLTAPIKGTENDDLALNIDLAATFADLAEVTPTLPPDGPDEIDGRSLVPLIGGGAPDPDWRSDFLVENAASGKRTYCAVRREGRLYVRWRSGEEELYNLNRDPYELNNLIADSDRRNNNLRSKRRRLKELCTPPPPGYPYGG
ncbi:MAG: sulfatase [Actinomycetota bacterium]